MACKYYKQAEEKRYIEGGDWIRTGNYRKGSLYEYDSADCPSPTPTPQYRTLTTATTCIGYDKYTLEEYQVSYDSGVTWTTTGTSATTLIEADSPDCGYIPPQYRTLTTATTCIGYDKYTLEEYQVSYDSGVTWTTTGTSATTLIEADSPDCGYIPPTPTFQGKWLATYTGGTTSSAECDSTSAITITEITSTNLISVEIGNCTTSIGYCAFTNYSTLTSVTIPDSVTIIGNESFRGCISLTSVTILDSVTSIGSSAFYGCSGLTSITIPDSVTTIGSGAFYGCSGLTNATIGSGVTSIDFSAFYDCRSLTSVTVLATTPPTIGNYLFQNTNDCPIYVPAASVSAYKSASGWSNYASRIQAMP